MKHSWLRNEWANQGLKNVIIELYGSVCNWCGGNKNLELDHIQPLCRLGTNSAGNIQILCRKCHQVKSRFDINGRHRKTKLSLAEKWWVEHRRYAHGLRDTPPGPAPEQSIGA